MLDDEQDSVAGRREGELLDRFATLQLNQPLELVEPLGGSNLHPSLSLHGYRSAVWAERERRCLAKRLDVCAVSKLARSQVPNLDRSSYPPSVRDRLERRHNRPVARHLGPT